MKSQFKDQVYQAVKQLKPFLKDLIREDWLTREGVREKGGFWSCFNPHHPGGDKTPSAHFVPHTDDQIFTCFGCSLQGDVIDANSAINGAPSSGSGWVKENVQTLLDRYHVPIQLSDPNEEDLRDIENYYLLQDAADILAGYNGFGLTQERGLKDEFCQRHGVGTVPSWVQFKDDLKKRRGYANHVLFSRGIASDVAAQDSYIFRPDRITIPVRNAKKKVVGFVARDCSGGSRGKPANTGKYLYNRGFPRRSALLGLDVVREHEHKRVYIVEGQIDCLQMQQGLITNVVAVGGSRIHPDQVQELLRAGVEEVVLCPDQTRSGEDSAQNPSGDYLVRKQLEILKEDKALRTYVVELPLGKEDKVDPDFFVLNQGAEEFRSLPIIDAFDWELERIPDEEDPEVTVARVVPLILSEPSAARRYSCCERVARRINWPTEPVWDAVKEKVDQERKEIARKIERTIDLGLRQISVAEGLEKVERAKALSHDLEQLQSEMEDPKSDSPENAVREFREVLSSLQDREGLSGLDSGFSWINDSMGGIVPSGASYGLLGRPHAGKSSFLRHLCHNLLELNPELVIFYHTIDDPKAHLYAGLIAIRAGIPIQYVTSGPLLRQELETNKPAFSRYKKAREAVEKWLSKDRLIVKDAGNSARWPWAKRYLENLRRRHPSTPLIYIIDNFHSADRDTDDERSDLERQSREMKKMASSEGITYFSTFEPRKGFGPLIPDDIKGSGKMLHDLQFLATIEEERTQRFQAVQWPSLPPEICNGDDLKGLPAVKIRIWKNKLITGGGFKGRKLFKHHSFRSFFEEWDPEPSFKRETQRAEATVADTLF